MLTTCAQIKLVKTHDQWILWPRFGKIHVQDRGRNGYCLALFSFCSFFIPPKDSEFKCCWIYSFLIEPWNLYMIKHSLTPYKLQRWTRLWPEISNVPKQNTDFDGNPKFGMSLALNIYTILAHQYYIFTTCDTLFCPYPLRPCLVTIQTWQNSDFLFLESVWAQNRVW